MEPFETIEVDGVEIACDGGAAPLGHPRVFLHIDHLHGDDTIQCPYCSRLYVLKRGSEHHAA